MTTVSVIVPLYNSEATLEQLIARLESVLPTVAEQFEIICVDDGSRDGSWDRLVALAAVHPPVRAIRLSRNFGQHNALLAGIRAAAHSTVVTLDDDLQNPPEMIPRLLDRLSEGCDVVYGTPEHSQHDRGRVLASRITRIALQGSMGRDMARNASSFRAFRTDLRDAFDGFSGPFVSIDVLLTWGTTSFGAVEVVHDRRQVGSSTYTMKKLVLHGLNMLTGFSTFPLQVASLIGFAFAAFGGLVLAWVLGRLWVTGESVPGFPFLASVIAIFSGAQLFALGIIGEYLARMHFRSMGRPSYLVRERQSGGPRG